MRADTEGQRIGANGLLGGWSRPFAGIALSRRNETRIAVAIAVAFFAQGLLGNMTKSLTFDEPTFIGSGYYALTHGEFRLNPSHPPLLQELEALPLLALNLRQPDSTRLDWPNEVNPTVSYGHALIFGSGNDPGRIAFSARLPILLLGAGLVLVVFMWGRALFGPGPALAAALVAGWSPNLIAHAKVATADFGSAALMCAAMWTYWRALESGTRGRWLTCGALTGLALLSKYTVLVLAPAYVIVAAVSWVARPEKFSVKALAIGWGIVLSATVLVVGMGYHLTFDYARYVRGIFAIYSDHRAGYESYLLGTLHPNARWYYNLVAFVLKVPVPTLLLLVMATVVSLRSRELWLRVATLLVPAGLVVIASFFDSANLGLRRILPAFPFLFLFAATAIAARPSRLRVGIVAVLLAWLIVDAVRIFPHHLAYFNVIAGGPERGPYLLDDSNIDWGQDLPALAAWQAANPHALPMKVFYFGISEPSAYGVEGQPMRQEDFERPDPGFYAISAHNLVWLRRVVKEFGADVDWLDKYDPVARAGYSIYIYRFP